MSELDDRIDKAIEDVTAIVLHDPMHWQTNSKPVLEALVAGELESFAAELKATLPVAGIPMQNGPDRINLVFISSSQVHVDIDRLLAERKELK